MKARSETPTKKLKMIYLIPRCIRRLFCRLNEHKILLNDKKFKTNTVLWYVLTENYPSELFSSTTRLEFEDACFTVMEKYHEYLTIIFGDYMELPPESERQGHNLELGDIIWDLDKSYKYYK